MLSILSGIALIRSRLAAQSTQGLGGDLVAQHKINGGLAIGVLESRQIIAENIENSLIIIHETASIDK